MLDEQARARLGISGEEFVRRWDAGDYEGRVLCDRPEVLKVAMLVPLGALTYQCSFRDFLASVERRH